MSKYGPFTISARERSRLAWRQRVDAAARAYHSERMAWRARVWDGKFGTFDWRVFKELADALAAPRPWRSPRKPDPRRRYSRSHRRACKWCRGGMEWLVLARSAESRGLFGLGCFRRDMYRHWRRNPHGRSDR